MQAFSFFIHSRNLGNDLSMDLKDTEFYSIGCDVGIHHTFSAGAI